MSSTDGGAGLLETALIVNGQNVRFDLDDVERQTDRRRATRTGD